MDFSDFSSMHNHTIFCDGRHDIETMCKSAYEKGLYAIGFSAHAPLPKGCNIQSFWNLPEEKADEYVQSVLESKKRWKDKLNVFLGFEVDYIKGLRTAKDPDILRHKPDYLLSSVHFLVPPNKEPLLTIDGSPEEFNELVNKGFNGDVTSLMHAYYDATIEMIKLGGFDILGHPDLIKKTCFNNKPWSVKEEEERQFEIAKLLNGKNIAVELNMGGINRNKFPETCPSPVFLKFLMEQNVPVIITADAHRDEHITGNYDVGVRVLIEAGYKEHIIFTGKIDGVSQWKKQKLI